MTAHVMSAIRIVNRSGTGPAPKMEREPKPHPPRGSEIGQRLDAIRARIEELEEKRRGGAGPGSGGGPAAASERLAAAQRHVIASQAAAERAAASCVRALRRAADAHERLAIQHDRSAASGLGDVAEHQRQAASHRAAAAADQQRAEQARSLISGRAPNPHDSDEQDGGPQGQPLRRCRRAVSVPLTLTPVTNDLPRSLADCLRSRSGAMAVRTAQIPKLIAGKIAKRRRSETRLAAAGELPGARRDDLRVSC